MNVLVPKAYNRISLCVVRALSKKGHRVIVGDDTPYSMAFYSRYALSKFLFPKPDKDPDGFLKAIEKAIQDYDINIILPVENDTFHIAKYADKLKDMVGIPISSYETLMSVQRKDRLSILLDKLKIVHPSTHFLSEIDDYEEIRNLIKGDVLLKPVVGGGGEGIIKLDKQKKYSEQILKYLKNTSAKEEDLIIQEYIPTKGKYSHVIMYQNGKLVQDFSDRHLRDYPFDGGSGCLRVTCDSGEMCEISRKLFDTLGWHGTAEVEYVRHKKTGKLYLIEVNPRLWGGINSAIMAGLDIPDIMVKIANGDVVNPIPYALNVKTRWLWGDIRSFLQYFRTKKPRSQAFLIYKDLIFSRIKTDEFYWDDPIPFLVWFAQRSVVNIMNMIKKRIVSI